MEDVKQGGDLVLAIHFDGFLVSGNDTVCEELLGVLNDQFSTQNHGEQECFIGRAVERNWKKGTIKLSLPAMVDALLARFDVKHYSSSPASPIAELGLTTDVVTDRSFRQAVSGMM